MTARNDGLEVEKGLQWHRLEEKKKQQRKKKRGETTEKRVKTKEKGKGRTEGKRSIPPPLENHRRWREGRTRRWLNLTLS